MKIVRSKEEIEKYISKLTDEKDNFTSDNYGSESADNGFYEEYFSSFATENTLRKFVNWLTNKEIV